MFFERNFIVKLVVFFTSFCWLWDFLIEDLKLKRNSDDVHWNVWRNIKKLYAQNNIFKKGIPNMAFWVILAISYFGPNFDFGDCFYGVFFLIFVVGQSWWPTFSIRFPTTKKLPTALFMHLFLILLGLFATQVNWVLEGPQKSKTFWPSGLVVDGADQDTGCCMPARLSHKWEGSLFTLGLSHYFNLGKVEIWSGTPHRIDFFTS